MPEEVVGRACWCQVLQCKVYPVTHAHTQLITTYKLVSAIAHNYIAELTTHIQSLFIVYGYRKEGNDLGTIILITFFLMK